MRINGRLQGAPLSDWMTIGYAGIFAGVLFAMVCFSGQFAAAAEQRHPEARERIEPILELRWGRNSIHQHVNPRMLKNYGVNRVWHSPFPGDNPLDPAEEANREFEFLQNRGFYVTVPPGSPDAEGMMEENPDWTRPGKSIYLHSRPTEAEGEELTIRLLDGHNASRVNFDMEPEKRWRVLNLSTDEIVPADRWKAEEISGEDGDEIDGEVTIEDASPGDRYSVIFPAGGGGEHLDKMLPEVQESREYWDTNTGARSVAQTDADFSRSIHVADFGHHIVKGDGHIQCWFTYGATLTPTTISYFEEKTGREIDPMWWINEQGEVRTSDDPPKRGYLEWIDSVQEQVLGYARGYTDWVHRNDAKAQLFQGDGWTGMEPAKGMVSEAGYDELTQPTNWSVDARRVTDFRDEGDIKRSIRIWEHTKEAFNVRWDSIRRAVLYRTPDGLSIGSQNADYHEDRPEYADAVKDALQEYGIFYQEMGQTEPYSHDLKLYVVNAWGELRAWPRSPWVNNPSQTTLMELTDLPIEVRFLSLDEIAEEGVPEDADVLLNVGEPGSAWSGGFHWSEEAASSIRDFVEAGGGLIGIDAPALDGDDEFLLGDVFGLEYGGRVSEAAEQELYRANAGLFREYEEPPQVDLGLSDDAPEPFSGLDSLGTVSRNVAMKPAGEEVQVLAEGGEDQEVLSTLNPYGEGYAAYISGNDWAEVSQEKSEDHGGGMLLSIDWSPGFGEYLKRLIYRVADRSDAMETLDSPTPGGHVYFYPETDTLFVYNRASENGEVEVRAGALAEEYGDSVGLRCIYHGHQREPSVQDQRIVTGEGLREGISLEVPRRSLYIYKIVEDPHENWPFGR